MSAAPEKEEDVTIYHIEEDALLAFVIAAGWHVYLGAMIEQINTEKTGKFIPDPSFPYGHEEEEAKQAALEEHVRYLLGELEEADFPTTVIEASNR